ncbi:class I SAM-dependent methyltransferase [Mycobacterium genavense]|uniref:class I SAM-dependent methyltransferase n=1 Tax=Mycobacterium genavense TaxID=36812 RepID=UPI001FE11F1A|nr:class I SAM-dependent methyltransferase [Mycobacterium genavense]
MTVLDMSHSVQKYWQQRNTVVGAFWDIDFLLFDRILRTQLERGVRGDLLEIGALYGKSAIVLGCNARPEEKVIVCDIFNDTEGGAENAAENAQSYAGLNRSKFEENYLRWVDQPPVVIQELSQQLVQRVEPRSLRFAHIDGSHLYNVVRSDIANSQTFVNDDGVVVMDDFRALHTPGVAAAVWEAVANDGLIPICISEQKFYGTWNRETARETRENLVQWAAAQGDAINCGIQEVAGTEVLLIQNPAPWKKYQIVIDIPTPWAKLRFVIVIPALWKKHPAAVRLRQILNQAWMHHYLGTRPI